MRANEQAGGEAGEMGRGEGEVAMKSAGNSIPRLRTHPFLT